MKKILSLILVTLLIFTIIPIGAITVSAATSGTTGDCTWSLDGTVLTISGNGEMGCYWYNSPWGTSITEVVIEDGVTCIGNSAFFDCSSLTSITIPDSVTSIGYFAFYNCSSLTSITIPDSVTSIGNHAFEDCSSLTSITIPDSVTSIGDYAFNGCYFLNSITIPDSVTSIGNYAFEDCSSLTNVCITDIASWCQIEFADICSNPMCCAEELYLNNKPLIKVVIPDGVTKIGNYAFYNCSSLTSITIPDSVTSIGYDAFYDCSSLTSITIGGSVTSIGDFAFSGCSSLTSITIPDSVISIGGWAFYNCSSLTGITIPDSVTSIYVRAFSDCSSLTSITIPDSVTSIGSYAFDGCSSLTSITIGGSVTSIGDSAFSYCSSLTSITIPDSVTSIGDSAFKGCYQLKSVYITDIAAWYQIDFYSSDSNPTSKGAKLYVNNQPLTSFKIPDNTEIWDTYAFYNCQNLENVFIPKSMILIKQDTFYNCSGIKNVYFEGTAEEWAEVTILSGNDYLKNATVYYNCSGIPGGITSISISKLPQKLKYIENEEDLDLTGGILTLNYDGGATKDIDLVTLNVTGFDNSIIGKQTITVKYGDYSAEFEVEVTAKPIDFIALSKSPNKTTYNVGEKLDLTGGQIFILYEAGDYQKLPLTADMVSGFDTNKEGIQVLTVTYKGYTDEFVITVNKPIPDFNGDKKTDVLDYVLFVKILLGDAEGGSANLDLDGDGIVNSSDLVVLKKHLLGIV